MQLNPPPSAEWEYAYETLLQDAWLSKKVDRERRLKDHRAYIDRYCRELNGKGLVIDIGPGPGEFLELCRDKGHEVLGIDAERGDGGMGDKYLTLSKLCTERQQIPVEYTGLAKWIDAPDPQGVVLINARGSIEQALSHCMTGPPHHEHQDCKRLAWQVNLAGPLLDRLFHKFARILVSGGHVLIHANGAANVDQYDIIVRIAATRAGLKLVHDEPPRLHKWVKP